MESLKALPDKIQMIDAKGEFLLSKTEEFLKDLKNPSSASSHYTVISIIGQQSGGKSYLLNTLFGTKFDVLDASLISYLLNTLFGTKFDVLDASQGINRTTQGIWIAKCVTPRIIIMDVEGYQGKEREEDTLFERQSAMLSLTVSDVLLLNMKYDNVGLAEPELLKLIFQERVSMKFASKTTLIICVRDYDYETPLHLTRKNLETRMNELWHKVHPAKTNRKMSDYIKVIVKDFPHYKYERENFDEKSKDLQELLCQYSTSGSLDQMHYVSSFAHGSKEIWDLIRKNKKITSADHKLAMSAHVCEEARKEIVGSLDEMMEYESVKSAKSVKEFNQQLKIFLEIIDKRYEDETRSIEGYKNRKQVKEKLVMKTIQMLEPTFANIIDRLCDHTLDRAKLYVRDELKNCTELDEFTLYRVLSPYMINFKDSCPDVHPNLEKIFTEKQIAVAEDLIEIAKKMAVNIEIKRLAYVGLKATAATLGGTAWLMGTCDPSMLIFGAASSTWDFAKTCKRLGNRSGISSADDIID